VLTVLVVGQEPPEDAVREPESTLEVLHARDADEAVEKLGRNRRIDAILLLEPGNAAETLAAIREDNPFPPPVFLPPGAPAIPGTRSLPAEGPVRLVEAVARALA
jgi:hypothetical protein